MARPRTLLDIFCANVACKIQFRPRYSVSKFCSPNCRHEHLSRPKKECGLCKTAFKGSYAQQKFCSHECKDKAATKNKEAICQECQVVFIRPHGKPRAYCSRTCSMKARMAGKIAHFQPLEPREKGKWITNHGYAVKKVDGKTKAMHRLEMEEKLVRPLESY